VTIIRGGNDAHAFGCDSCLKRQDALARVCEGVIDIEICTCIDILPSLAIVVKILELGTSDILCTSP